VTILRLVFDTNVLISAALSARGMPARLVQFALAHHQLVFSQATFDELQTRLYRPKLDPYVGLELRQRLLHDFSASAHWVEIAQPQKYCRDSDDEKFIDTALQAGASLLMSGDGDLLEAPEVTGLQILDVQAAAAWLKL
jgi:uncharacterized protein